MPLLKKKIVIKGFIFWWNYTQVLYYFSMFYVITYILLYKFNITFRKWCSHIQIMSLKYFVFKRYGESLVVVKV